MPNGMNENQMVERMYTELVGLDGKSGMVQAVHETKGRVALLENVAMTKIECAAVRKGMGDRKDKYLMRIKDFILLALAILGFLWGSGVIK